MSNDMIAETSIEVNAGPDAVWKAITTPEHIEKFLMGTRARSDWKEGSPIEYEGEYNGHKYHDKGIIKKLVPGKIFSSTYWSSMGGKEDKPENYNLVTYRLEAKGQQTVVTLTQDNVRSENEQKHVIENWSQVLKKLKEVAEEI